ncbi:MAG: DMT family transporter [Desulfomicrobium escambiense]|nr:DMT family transporter [Desulfomicrobium escambiense]
MVFLAQICMTWGYKHVPVSRGSRIFYLETLLAIGFGALLGERLRPAFFAGGALIAAGLAFDAWNASRRNFLEKISALATPSHLRRGARPRYNPGPARGARSGRSSGAPIAYGGTA